MFLKQFKTAKNISSILAYQSYSANFASLAKPVDVKIRKDLLSLTFQLSGENAMNFFISPSMSFKNLRELILAQYPSADFEFDFSHSKKDSIDEDSNIVKFLNSNNSGQVNIEINQDTFSLKNVLAEPLSSIVLPNLEEAARDPNRVVHWYKKCLDAGLQPSHAGTLSYFLKNLNAELEKMKAKGKISEKEIETAIKASSAFGREPINKKLEETYHELNAVTSQIQEIETEKISIEEKAEKKINLYLKLILLATLVQFCSFYYAIFHVDWLGKFLFYF